MGACNKALKCSFNIAGLCAATGSFDIEGGFGNVFHPILLDRPSSLGTPSYLVSWSESFFSNRSITLVYPGAPNHSVLASVRVLQGSPVSPLFSVIYIAPLHTPDGISFRLSYVDDFSLIAVSIPLINISRCPVPLLLTSRDFLIGGL